MLSAPGLFLIVASAPLSAQPEVVPSVELVLTRKIVERRPVPNEPSAAEFLAGETIYAFTAIANLRASFVEHVWYQDGQEIAHHYLPLGSSSRWRTWSRHKLTVGRYEVKILSPDGRVLQTATFKVEPVCML